jgi:hypothetical protein
VTNENDFAAGRHEPPPFLGVILKFRGLARLVPAEPGSQHLRHRASRFHIARAVAKKARPADQKIPQRGRQLVFGGVGDLGF